MFGSSFDSLFGPSRGSMLLPRIARSYTGGESFVPSAVTPSSDCVLVKGCLRDNPIENHPNAATNIKTADKTALTISL